MRASDLAGWFLDEMWASLGGEPGVRGRVELHAAGHAGAAFGGEEIVAAALGAVGAAVSELVSVGGHGARRVRERHPPLYVPRAPGSNGGPVDTDPNSGSYATKDERWVHFCSDYGHLRKANLGVLGVDDPDPLLATATWGDAAARQRQAIVRSVRGWHADELEAAVRAAGGTCAASRSVEEWAAHPQGLALAAEAVVDVARCGPVVPTRWAPGPARPLRGLRVLDMTRVLAGPLATQLLAGLGADVLRVDPPGYPELSSNLALTGQGKRCAWLDLASPQGFGRFAELLASADVFVHGLRPGALEALGAGPSFCEEVRPGLVEVCLDAYGWTGPWRGYRGFDSLVAVSTGMAVQGMARTGVEHPVLLPGTVLDRTTGYLAAAAAVRGLTQRSLEGVGSRSRCALASSATLLVKGGAPEAEPPERTHQAGAAAPGTALRVDVEGVTFAFERPMQALGSSPPEWW